MPAHEQHMQRAIELATLAEGCTSPNPLVGCVLARDDKIVGEGWHQMAGSAHAEVNAINDAGDQASGATMYITLEPCTHFGRTPPCTDAILTAGISKVIYAVCDPNPAATGGASVLRQAGLAVLGGVLEASARHMNRFYLHAVRHKRPFVVAKYAASLDGRIATRSGHSQWITGPEARQRGHQLRQATDAIIVGAQTIIDDNPALTVRLDSQPGTSSAPVRHPRRIVLDSAGKIPLNRQVFSHSLPGETQVFTTAAMPVVHADALARCGVTVTRVAADTNQRVSLDAVLQELAAQQVQSVMVEGGQTLLGAFLDRGLINEVWAFLAPMLIGGKGALPAFGGQGCERLEQAARLINLSTEKVGDDLLVRGQLTALQESA